MDNVIIDYREIKSITLKNDAKDIKIQKLGKDTHIMYISESHPNKTIIEVVEGHWTEQNIIGNTLTLKED